MIHETGTVISVSETEAWVQTIRANTCQSCSARHGCGQKALATLSAGQSRQIRVSNSLQARPGDQVTVAIEESALLKASLLVYALPLGLLVVLTGIAGMAFPGEDLVAIAAAVTGLGAGLFLARHFSRGGQASWQPIMGELVAQEAESPLP